MVEMVELEMVKVEMIELEMVKVEMIELEMVKFIDSIENRK